MVCNVHGVSPNFLDIGDRVRERALSLLEDGFSSEDEVSSARIQPQAAEGFLFVAPEKSAKEGRGQQEGLEGEERRGLFERRTGNEPQLDGRTVGLVKDASLSGWLKTSADSSGGDGERPFEEGEDRGQDLQLTPGGSSEAEQTPTSVLHGRVFEERGRGGGEATASISDRSAGVPVLGGRRSRSQISGGCYFIGRAIWGKGYHELSQLLQKQKEELELQSRDSDSPFLATKEGAQAALRSPNHKVVQLEDLDGHALRPGGEKVDPDGGAVPLVQERGGGSTFRLLNLCMRSKFLWHLQTMWLRRRYGDRLKWLEHGRRAFCALQGGGERAQPGNPPETGMGQRAPLERVHSESGQVNSIVELDRATCGGDCERLEEAGGGACEIQSGSTRDMGRCTKGGVSESGAAGGGLAELVHVDCYGTGPHEGEIEAFAKEHALPLTFHGRIDHKELVQYKVRGVCFPRILLHCALECGVGAAYRHSHDTSFSCLGFCLLIWSLSWRMPYITLSHSQPVHKSEGGNRGEKTPGQWCPLFSRGVSRCCSLSQVAHGYCSFSFMPMLSVHLTSRLTLKMK